jgi:hypothetical protein
LVDEIKNSVMVRVCGTYTGFWWGDVMNRDYVKGLDVDGKIMLKWDGRHGLDCSGLGQGQVVGACECGNEPSGSIKCREFLD